MKNTFLLFAIYLISSLSFAVCDSSVLPPEQRDPELQFRVDGCSCEAYKPGYNNGVCSVCDGSCTAQSAAYGGSGGGGGSCTSGSAPPFDSGTGSGVAPSAVCIGGCTYGTGSVCLSGNGSWSCDIGSGTGQTCEQSGSTSYSATSTSNGCTKKGLCGGDVNGVEVCHVCTPDTKIVTKTPVTETITKTQTDPVTNQTTTTTEIINTIVTTSCQGGQCTTTKDIDTSVSSGDPSNPTPGGTGTKTDTKTEPQSSFCSQNPDSVICKGFDDPCTENPDRSGCKLMGTPSDSDGGTMQTKSVGLSAITVVPLSSNASCPAPIQLPYGMNFDFGMMCTYATSVRPIVLVLAWIAAGMIVFGFKSSES